MTLPNEHYASSGYNRGQLVLVPQPQWTCVCDGSGLSDSLWLNPRGPVTPGPCQIRQAKLKWLGLMDEGCFDTKRIPRAGPDPLFVLLDPCTASLFAE